MLKNWTGHLVELKVAVFLLMFTVVAAGAYDSQTHTGSTFGCFPDGSVFNAMVPDAVDLREVAYLTPFGTLNTNLVVGDQVGGKIVAGVGDLCERIGEFVTSVNVSAPVQPMVFTESMVPQKYLTAKTVILCGGPEANQLVRQLVQTGKSTVDWAKATTGTIEVVRDAFGGPGTAIIAGGATAQGTYTALTALARFFVHLAGANLAEEGLLRADAALRRGDVKGAARNIRVVLDGLRLDGTAKINNPVKNHNAAFEKVFRNEGKMAQDLVSYLEQTPTLAEADAAFRKLAASCNYCHTNHVAHDRMGQNRVKFHYLQYPETRCETSWVKSDTATP